MRTYVFLFGLLLGLAATAASARDYKIGDLTVTDPWSRATPKGAKVAAGYMKITNTGTAPDRLISGSSDVSASFQIHEMSMDHGVAKMRPLKDGIEIKPGQTVELAPGSFHLMFVDLKKPLNQGDHFKATLVFDKAGKVDVEYDVLAMGATPSSNMPGMRMQH